MKHEIKVVIFPKLVIFFLLNDIEMHKMITEVTNVTLGMASCRLFFNSREAIAAIIGDIVVFFTIQRI